MPKEQPPNVHARKQLRDFAKFLEDAARKALPHANNEKNRVTLSDAANLLAKGDGSVENLIAIVEAYECVMLWLTEAWNDLRPEDHARLNFGPFIPNGLIDVSSVLWAATKIGDLAIRTREMRQPLDAMRKAQTAPATEELRTNSQRVS